MTTAGQILSTIRRWILLSLCPEDTMTFLVRVLVLAGCSKLLCVSLHVTLLAVITLSFMWSQDLEGGDGAFRSPWARSVSVSRSVARVAAPPHRSGYAMYPPVSRSLSVLLNCSHLAHHITNGFLKVPICAQMLSICFTTFK